MAHATKATKRAAPAPKAAPSSVKPAKAKAKALAPKAAPAKAPAERAPMVTKGELRTQMERLEQTIATLRTKSREANRAAKLATARIAELEEDVARLEKQVASQAASAKRSATRAAGRKGKEIDPGDAVPPGVAVQEPQPLDEQAETALENLEHLGEGDEAGWSEEKLD